MIESKKFREIEEEFNRFKSKIERENKSSMCELKYSNSKREPSIRVRTTSKTATLIPAKAPAFTEFSSILLFCTSP